MTTDDQIDSDAEPVYAGVDLAAPEQVQTSETAAQTGPTLGAAIDTVRQLCEGMQAGEVISIKISADDKGLTLAMRQAVGGVGSDLSSIRVPRP